MEIGVNMKFSDEVKMILEGERASCFSNANLIPPTPKMKKQLLNIVSKIKAINGKIPKSPAGGFPRTLNLNIDEYVEREWIPQKFHKALDKLQKEKNPALGKIALKMGKAHKKYKEITRKFNDTKYYEVKKDRVVWKANLSEVFKALEAEKKNLLKAITDVKTLLSKVKFKQIGEIMSLEKEVMNILGDDVEMFGKERNVIYKDLKKVTQSVKRYKPLDDKDKVLIDKINGFIRQIIGALQKLSV